MYKIVVYIPTVHVKDVKTAMFNAGAGKLGNYDCCSWETEGTGQFRPLDGANPSIGSLGSVEKVPETRVETLCDRAVINDVIAALKMAHPYEEPAYDIYELARI